MIDDEIDPDLTRSLLIQVICGEKKLPRYQRDAIIEKFIKKNDDPFGVAKEIAQSVARGLHLWDATTYVRLLAPDLPKEALKRLAVDVFIKVGAIIIAEEIDLYQAASVPTPTPRKVVEEMCIDGILSAWLIDGATYEKIQKMVSTGIEYHLALLGKQKIKKRKRYFFF